MNLFNIQNSFDEMGSRGWNRLYWFVDVHNTILFPDYGDPTKKRLFFPHAKETLQFLTTVNEICLVLWSCSHRDSIDEMLVFFKKNNIKFDYINENPECHSDTRVNFTQKPYYNVLLDDRAGFDPDTDWKAVGALLEDHYNTKFL